MRQRAKNTLCKALSLLLLSSFSMAGCTAEQIIGGTLAATALGSYVEPNKLSQHYYLGVFDPQEQVPPSIYRVKVTGSASFISRVKFGSGWVKADLIDSLGTGIEYNRQDGNMKISRDNSNPLVHNFQTGRRLMLFGPEGFREAPKDHRLVIVMGTSPEEFFQAIDQSLGIISKAQFELKKTSLKNDIFKVLQQLKSEKERLASLEKDVTTELKSTVGVVQ